MRESTSDRSVGELDLTALAVLAGWSVLITAIDIARDTLLTAATAGIAHAVAARWRLTARA